MAQVRYEKPTSGPLALDRLVEAEKKYWLKNHHWPKEVVLPYAMALSLIKLGAEFYGPELAAKLWVEGVDAFKQIHGMKVIIDMTRRPKLIIR